MVSVEKQTDECVLSLYPIDMKDKQHQSNHVQFRISPFDEYVISNDHLQIINDLVQYDKDANIYYYHLGCMDKSAAMQQAFFFTPNLLWPALYTIIIWIKWESDSMVKTTFDSSSDSPIFVNSQSRLGCASHNHGWKSLNYNVPNNEWQFVAVLGGNDNSDFYIGDLQHPPKFEGSVSADIAGATTTRIGNLKQGPGKIGSLIVYKGHINIDILTDIYHQTILEMGDPWSVQKKNVYKKELMYFVKIENIADLIIQCLSK